MKKLALFAVVSLAMFGCGGGSPAGDSGTPPADRVTPSDSSSMGPTCSAITGDYMLTATKTNPDTCTMPAAGMAFSGTLRIQTGAMPDTLDISIVYGMETIACRGNFNTATCQFMGTCDVPGATGMTETVNFSIANNAVAGSTSIAGDMGCRTTYTLAAVRN